MFFKEFPNWYYILIYCFQSNIFKIVFRCIFKLASVCQNSVSGSNTKTVLLSAAVFVKEILKWFFFQIECFQSLIFNIVCHRYITLTMSSKTLFLTVIPFRYYCQKQCFAKKYQRCIQNTVSGSNTQMVFLSKHCFWE